MKSRSTALSIRPRAAGPILAALLAVLGCALFATPALADTIKLKNGQTYNGKVVSRDSKKVVFRIEVNGTSREQSFDASEVVAIESSDAKPANKPAGEAKDAPKGKAAKEPETVPLDKKEGQGEAYYVLPIRGTIGVEVSAEIVRECLQAARELQAKIVVLEINSPGGSIRELKSILAALDACSDLHIVAFVEEAKSAAAILALSRKDIIMAKRASIGAAVPYKVGPDGTPQNIEAKLESSILADFRAAAESGGHDALIVEGMTRNDMELSLNKLSEGRYKVVRGAGDKPLLKRGDILTLTTKQAKECGLILGSVENLPDCRKFLKMDYWYDVSDHGRLRAQKWADEIHAAQEKYREAFTHFQTALEEVNRAAKAKRRSEVNTALRRCETGLRVMEEIASKYSCFGNAESLHSAREEVKAIRRTTEP